MWKFRNLAATIVQYRIPAKSQCLPIAHAQWLCHALHAKLFLGLESCYSYTGVPVLLWLNLHDIQSVCTSESCAFEQLLVSTILIYFRAV